MAEVDPWPIDDEVPGSVAVHVDADTGAISLHMAGPDGYCYQIRLPRESARMMAEDLAKALISTHTGALIQ